ncbi:MAG: DUF2851 family protein [Chloroflexi bacterium]|nr:DUF2851 family protein [Chloroflexota bacterium]
MSLMIAERPHSVDSERALASLWERAGTLRDGLTTQDGQRYWVSYPGRPNPRAGPDFLDARLLNEAGESVTGDVELHLNAPDWYGHGHHADPNYNGVVLHVVLSAKGHSTTSQHSKMRVPIASLQDHLDRLDILDAAEPLKHEQGSALETADLEARLDLAGDERFLARCRGFALELNEGTADQVIYRSLMEALGYASNRKPFRQLADVVPFSALAMLGDEPTSIRALALHAMLLSASGLISLIQADPQTKELLRLSRLLPLRPSPGSSPGSSRVRPLSLDQWRLFRVRPSNHPLRRIQGAVHILENCLKSGLSRLLQDVLATEGASGLEAIFRVKPFIGAGRAGDITVNVALPFLRALAQRESYAELAELTLNAYKKFPGLADNEITREMRKQMGLPSKSSLSARRHQGLMHLYRSSRRSAVN